MDDEKVLVGKTIKEVDIDGYGVNIVFVDGTIFDYGASDGGCSSWDIIIESEGGE